MVATDGGVFSFGDARFFGSTGDIRLNKPIVGMAATPTGEGYWMVASDGGIFAFGDARFFGSTGALKLAQPITGIAATPSGQGYWLTASDGGVFSFGDATYRGAAPERPSTAPRSVVALVASPSGTGYWQASASGELLAFGDAVDLGHPVLPQPACRRDGGGADPGRCHRRGGRPAARGADHGHHGTAVPGPAAVLRQRRQPHVGQQHLHPGAREGGAGAGPGRSGRQGLRGRGVPGGGAARGRAPTATRTAGRGPRPCRRRRPACCVPTCSPSM